MAEQVPKGVDEWWTDDEWWRWLPNLFGVPRRFTGGFYLALGASLLLLVASIWPQGGYSPSVAVQAFTAGAIIWYTFFTYRAAQGQEQTRLHTEPYFSLGQVPKAGLKIFNRSERDVYLRVQSLVYADEEIVRTEAFTTHLGPHDQATAASRLEEELLEEDQWDVEAGRRTLEFSASQVHVRSWVNWRDDLGERGIIGPRTYSSRL